jgi:hypothetical protein
LQNAALTLKKNAQDLKYLRHAFYIYGIHVPASSGSD